MIITAQSEEVVIVIIITQYYRAPHDRRIAVLELGSWAWEPQLELGIGNEERGTRVSAVQSETRKGKGHLSL